MLLILYQIIIISILKLAMMIYYKYTCVYNELIYIIYFVVNMPLIQTISVQLSEAMKGHKSGCSSVLPISVLIVNLSASLSFSFSEGISFSISQVQIQTHI